MIDYEWLKIENERLRIENEELREERDYIQRKFDLWRENREKDRQLGIINCPVIVNPQNADFFMKEDVF